MRDRHFMEDENELPYLVWETRDNQQRNDTGTQKTTAISFKDIPFNEFSSYVHRLSLTYKEKTHIINSVEIKVENCIFSIYQSDDELSFTFTVKNEYVKTKLNFIYDPESCQLEYTGGTTYHHDLESMKWFKDAVNQIEKEKGYKFEFCFEGHDFSWREGKVLINGDFESKVMFEKDGYDDHFDYKIDFTNKKLEFDHKYAFHEYYAFFSM